MDTTVGNQPQGSSTSLSSLFVPSGPITGAVTDRSPFTGFLSPSTSTSATAPEVDDNNDNSIASSTTTGLGYSTSNSTSSSAPIVSSVPTAAPPKSGSIATGELKDEKTTGCSLVSANSLEQGLNPGEEAGIAIGAAAGIALFVWW